MTTSITRSATFTISDARYVASKLGADLRNLNARYGCPSLADIDDYVEETAQYLRHGYLNTVDYGFKDSDRWVLRLRYTAVAGGHLSDATPGGLPSAVEVAGYPFYSYLKTNAAFDALTSVEQQEFQGTLPVKRTGAAEPTANAGSYGSSRQYSRNGNGLSRDVYRTY